MAVTCPKCGTVDTGTYCSSCGTVLPSEAGRTWLTFVDSFLKFRERARYLRTYRRILASPTRNTLALFAEGDAAEAFEFLQTSLLIYTLAVVSQLFTGGALVSELVIPLLFLVGNGSFLAIFYGLVRRRSPRPQSGHDFLILSAYSTGFTLPFAAALQAFLRVEPWLGLLPVAVASIPLGVYVTRVWAEFWNVPKRKVFLYLFILSMVSTVVATVFGVFWAFAHPPAEVRTTKAVLEQLVSWNTSYYHVSPLLDEQNFREQNFSEFNSEILKVGQSGASVRTRFASVPDDLDDGEHLFDLLIEAGDSAVAWADVIETDPPPYRGTPEQVLRKGTTLTDAARRFVEALNKVNRAMEFPQVSTDF
jgi:hypothetical protein